ncbi:GlsB/YeaQ/YmgE family stress response membrane protein [Nocardioides sp. SYSU DS0651]|uniref:GlsB/YeaQ/YmgE family stress response membrane protein n=1 Tax=Nocardioides sp. SYSU DS0651 TaxID=3415955 RepID=UPI003F4B6821
MFQILGFIIIGAVIGVLARLLKPGRQSLGFLGTIGLGMVGALIGGIVASLLGTGAITELNVIGFVVAVVAAVLLVGIAEGMVGKQRHRGRARHV